MQKNYWIQPIEKIIFLKEIIKFLNGNAIISLEGTLSEFDVSSCTLTEMNSTYELHQVNTPENSDFIVMAMDQNFIKAFFRFLKNDDILHTKVEFIQIEINGELQFLAGDYFHRECISVGPLVTANFLNKLKDQKIIKTFQTDVKAKAKYPWLNKS